MLNTSNKLQGFSLLELLIALVVFSIGLLAIAGLQTVSKQANYEACLLYTSDAADECPAV